MSALLAAMLMLAAPHPQPFPTRAGECGWVHGRFSISNGSSIQRIWVIGTSHMLALFDDDDHYPAAMRQLLNGKSFVPFKTDMFGDFKVCASERWIPGHMQHVRIVSARNLIVAHR